MKDKPIQVTVEVRGGVVQDVSVRNLPRVARVNVRVIDWDNIEAGDNLKDQANYQFKGKDVR